MMTCKDCIHEKVCVWNAELEQACNEDCSDFKNKADYAEVKHGEWIESQYVSKKLGIPVKNEFIFACSVCGHDAIGKSKYCRECGAKMDGGVTDEQIQSYGH